MDNFAFELELLLKQPNCDEAPYVPGLPPVNDPASPAAVGPSCAPPVTDTGDSYAGGTVSPPLRDLGGNNATIMAAIHRAPSYFGKQFAFPAENGFTFASMPDPLAPPSAAERVDLPAAGGAAGEENAFFASNQVSPLDPVGLETALPVHARQVPRIDHYPLQALFYQHRPAYLNPGGCGSGGGGAEDGSCLEPNWEAIEWYLAGQVRPGPDVARIYKCSICKMEFPNAQAYGGHMSSHSKTKKGETKKPVAARESKQFKKISAKEEKLARPHPPSVRVLSPTNKLEAADSLGEEKPRNKIARTSK